MHTPNASKASVRVATENDNIGIRKVQVTTWKHAYRGLIPDRILDQMTIENPPQRAKQPDPVLAASRRALVVVDDSQEVLGFAVGGIAREKDWNYEAELWAIYVLPSLQGQGIGSSLFAALKSELTKDYKNMILWVLEGNHASHKFYESMGGKKLGLKKNFKWENEPIATEIAYGWNLLIS